MIVVNGNKYRTLSDNLYVNGSKVMKAFANGVQVYPEESDSKWLKVTWEYDGDVDTKFTSANGPQQDVTLTFKLSVKMDVAYPIWTRNNEDPIFEVDDENRIAMKNTSIDTSRQPMARLNFNYNPIAQHEILWLVTENMGGLGGTISRYVAFDCLSWLNGEHLVKLSGAKDKNSSIYYLSGGINLNTVGGSGELQSTLKPDKTYHPQENAVHVSLGGSVSYPLTTVDGIGVQLAMELQDVFDARDTYLNAYGPSDPPKYYLTTKLYRVYLERGDYAVIDFIDEL